MNELVFFEIPKQNLKIQIVKKSDEILEQIRKESAETAVMPDVAQYYTDIYFPKAPSDRPYTFSSIVLSSDGKMAYGDNPSGPLIAKNNFLDPALDCILTQMPRRIGKHPIAAGFCAV